MLDVITFTDTLIMAPVQPPMTVDYAKKHLRSLTDREDDLIRSWILAAASYFEEQTGRVIITQTRELWLDRFPATGRLQLPKPPLQGVDSVSYLDGSGALVPFSDGASPETVSYTVNAPAGDYAARGWIEPLYGTLWPTVQTVAGAVRVQYRCGYGDTPETVPDLIKAILAWLVANFDQNRTPTSDGRFSSVEIPIGVQYMLDGFKYSALPTMVHR